MRPAAVLLAISLSGCIAPIALDRAVMSYDSVANDTVSRQLLLNIARAHHNEPVHFTALSNIAATFSESTVLLERSTSILLLKSYLLKLRLGL